VIVNRDDMLAVDVRLDLDELGTWNENPVVRH